MKSQQDLINEILQERKRQDAKWGVQNHRPIEWMAILMEEVGEASREALEMHFTKFYQDKGQGERYEKELIQVAAVALHMLESYEIDKQQLKLEL
jgi:NTP pyrophosphatase (non-canonical NTP hydrolase)